MILCRSKHTFKGKKMATEQKEDLDLNIQEEKDGSAVVDLPDAMLGDDFVEKNTQASDKSGDGEVDAEDVDHPNDDQELREAKRNRRKAKRQAIRATNHEKDIRLQQLQRENEEFKRRLSNVERETKQSQISRIDKNIEDSQVRLEYAKMKLKEAAENSDGDAMVEAQTLWREAEGQLAQLQNIKDRASQEINDGGYQDAPDPNIQRKAAEWMRKNNWYNPDGNDSDSRVAKKVDELLVTEGWNPTDPDYWDELDSRLQKSLPHRYNGTSNENSVVRRPRNVVGSSGREASAAYGGNNRSSFVLSPERVKAMKEIGAWDNPERKRKMIAEFVRYDRLNAN
jgi:hypothetical protein